MTSVRAGTDAEVYAAQVRLGVVLSTENLARFIEAQAAEVARLTQERDEQDADLQRAHHLLGCLVIEAGPEALKRASAQVRKDEAESAALAASSPVPATTDKEGT